MASRDLTFFLKWQRRSFQNLTWNCLLQSNKNLILWLSVTCCSLMKPNRINGTCLRIRNTKAKQTLAKTFAQIQSFHQYWLFLLLRF